MEVGIATELEEVVGMASALDSSWVSDDVLEPVAYMIRGTISPTGVGDGNVGVGHRI